MQRRSRLFLALFVAISLLLFSGDSRSQEDYPVLVEENLEWQLLPSDLNRKVFPLSDPGDLRLRLGEAEGGQQYLKVMPPRLRDLSLGIKSTEDVGSYIASAKRAIYWPRQHLLRLEEDVIVSSTHCNLKGETFDIHLYHDTIRLEEPEEIEISGTSLPIVSQGIRISGLGHNRKPEFEWDPVVQKNASSQEPVPAQEPTSRIEVIQEPTPAPAQQYRLEVGDRWELVFQGKEIDPEDLQKEILRIGKDEPESSLLVEQSAAADPDQVRNLHRTLDQSGIRKIQTTIVPSSLSRSTLRPEIEPKQLSAEDDSLPPLSELGGRLLWIHEPGRYRFGGKEYTEAGLRQALRTYAREYSDLTLVIASSRNLPQGYLRELVQDFRAYGFKHILVGVEAATLSQ